MDALLDGDFVLVRMALVDALEGDYRSAIILQRIAWRCEATGSWTATAAEIAEEVRMSLRTVERSLGMLRKRGLLTRRDAARMDRTSVWSIGPGTNPGVHGPAKMAGTEAAKMAGSTYTKTLREVGVHTPPSDVAVSGGGSPSSTAAFEEFWEHYPRKAGKNGKYGARAAFDRATKRASPDTIVAAAAALAADPNLPPARYVPYPATWLNRDGWEEGPLPPRFNGGKPSGEDVVARGMDLVAQLRAEERAREIES